LALRTVPIGTKVPHDSQNDKISNYSGYSAAQSLTPGSAGFLARTPAEPLGRGRGAGSIAGQQP